jgi:hypothetical protein
MQQPKKSEAAYNLIARSANENATIQGACGLFGTVFSIGADVFAIAKYSAMWNNIRVLYGHDEFEINQVKSIIPKIGKEIISDIVFDKVLGYVPVIGIATNIMCAKSMSWRLGILFAMLSSRGSDMPEDSIIKAVKLIREMYPQRDMFSFTTPDKISVIRMIENISNNSVEEFDQKVCKALAAFN